MDGPRPAAPPPLTRWQSSWRYLFAAVVGASFWVSGIFDLYDGHPTVWYFVELSLGALCVVLLRWRRRSPFPIALLVLAVGGFATAASGAVIVMTVSLATRRRWREIVPAVVVSILATAFYFEIHDDSWDSRPASLLFAVAFAAAVTAAGMYVGARRDLLAQLKERADRAEREQTLRVEQAHITERTRIAREMHDVLAHRLSLVAMNAGALEYCRSLSADEVAEAAAITRRNAHLALDDLHDILGVLRGVQAEAAPERPQPTLGDLPALVLEAQDSGTNVRLHNEIDDQVPPPEAIGRSAYRMIQESLTNARKHAPDTAVDIRLSGHAGGQLVLEVRNPLRVGAGVAATRGSGLGLLGLNERAELTGGRFEHTVSDGDFVVRAWLPWPA